MSRFIVRVSAEKKIPVAFKAVCHKAVSATLKRLPKTALKSLGKRRAPHLVSVHLVSSATIRRLNRAYRRKDKPTDVLSFSSLETPFIPTVKSDVGEVFICWTVAKRQAREFEIPLKLEVQRLVIHGILHLFGYDHEKSPQEEKRMFRLQDSIWRSLR